MESFIAKRQKSAAPKTRSNLPIGNLSITRAGLRIQACHPLFVLAWIASPLKWVRDGMRAASAQGAAG